MMGRAKWDKSLLLIPSNNIRKKYENSNILFIVLNIKPQFHLTTGVSCIHGKVNLLYL